MTDIQKEATLKIFVWLSESQSIGLVNYPHEIQQQCIYENQCLYGLHGLAVDMWNVDYRCVITFNKNVFDKQFKYNQILWAQSTRHKSQEYN